MTTVKPGGPSGAAGGSPEAPPAGRYDIDTSRSAITFRTRHLFGLAPVRGRFTIRAGSVEIARPVADSRVHVEIEAASFRTRNPMRDGAVKGPGLLDAGRHPVLTFASGGPGGTPGGPGGTPGGPGGPALPGTLTVRGVTRPVSLLVEQTEVSPGSFTARGTVRIDRAEFGVTGYRGLAGRYLDMTVEVRAVRT